MSIFFINHALRVNQLSVFNEEQRFEQTLETVSSINKYCPNNVKFIFDSSPEEPRKEYINKLSEFGVIFTYCGKIPEVYNFSMMGKRSLAECISFDGFLHWFKSKSYKSNRIYKISGRYRLTDNFIADDDGFKDAFVFADALDSWMPKEKIQTSGVDKLYRLRLWHMDYSLLDTFHKTLPQIFCDCRDYDIDIEHAYYKNLHKHKTVELSKIGICGNIAPNGEWIDE